MKPTRALLTMTIKYKQKMSEQSTKQALRPNFLHKTTQPNPFHQASACTEIRTFNTSWSVKVATPTSLELSFSNSDLRYTASDKKSPVPNEQQLNPQNLRSSESKTTLFWIWGCVLLGQVGKVLKKDFETKNTQSLQRKAELKHRTN